VRLEPSGWGTRVTLTAEPATGQPQPEPEPQPEPDPAPEPRLGFWARLFGRRPAPVAASAPEPEPAPAPAGPALDAEHAVATLTGVLDTLGAAHHRPFSRP
jgi:hypothetical protein